MESNDNGAPVNGSHDNAPNPCTLTNMKSIFKSISIVVKEMRETQQGPPMSNIKDYNVKKEPTLGSNEVVTSKVK